MSKTYALTTFHILNGEVGTCHYRPFEMPSNETTQEELQFRIAQSMLDYFGIDRADAHHFVEDTYRKAKAGEPLNENEQSEIDDLVDSVLDEGFTVNGNQQHLELYSCKFITEQEYEVLKKFLG